MAEKDTKKPGMTRAEYAEQVANTVIKQLKEGTAPWQKPWAAGGDRAMPYNPISGKDYKGGNAIYLWATAIEEGYDDSRWLTYKQAAAEGAQVKKGEKGTRIEYVMMGGMETKKDEQGKPVAGADGKPVKIWVEYERPRVMPFTVFNAAQIDGLPETPKREPFPEWERHARAEKILEAPGVPIKHEEGNRAFYKPSTDTITMPNRDQFAAPDGYYATALHELGHATGHVSRLDRDLAHPFGSVGYAKEELRAEIASLMLGDQLGIGHDPNQHAAYVGSWIKVLEEDPREIFKASADAEKIAKFVIALENKEEQALSAALTQGADAAMTAERSAPVLISGNAAMHNVGETVLAVPYREKDEAKAAAKDAGFSITWDKKQSQWTAPAGADLSAMARWLPENRATQQVSVEAPEEQFKTALEAEGLIIDGLPVMDGTRQRVPVKGDARGMTSGSYKGFVDGHPAGSIQNFKTDTKTTWKMEGAVETLTSADKARLHAEHAERKVEREAALTARQNQTATAGATLLSASVNAPDDHPYLHAKGLSASSLRAVPDALAAPSSDAPYQIGRDLAHATQLREDFPDTPVFTAGDLIIPIHNAAGEIRNVQTISPNGFKGFAKHGEVAGCFYETAPNPQAVEKDGLGPVIVAEGWATSETLREAAPNATVVTAFNAGNMQRVAENMRVTYPDRPIVIAGDNDHKREAEGKPNVGRQAAMKAAKAVNGHAALPQFRAGEDGSDWNDVAQSQGNAVVKLAMLESMAIADRKMIADAVYTGHDGARAAETVTLHQGMVQAEAAGNQNDDGKVQSQDGFSIKSAESEQAAFLAGTYAQLRNAAEELAEEPQQTRAKAPERAGPRLGLGQSRARQR